MTDALQQRSLYQCALMKNAPFIGEILAGFKTTYTEVSRDFYLVLERRYYGYCSWKVTEDSFKTKDTDKNTCKQYV